MKLQIPAQEVNNIAVTGKSLLRPDLWSDKCDPYVPAWKTICGCIFIEWNDVETQHLTTKQKPENSWALIIF